MLLDQLMDQIDGRMARLMPEAGPASTLYGMMRYHLGWADESLRPARSDAGKRIRARLCLLSCAAAGSDPERALPPATAVELVHNFSLIHDDIQDRSQYRRHRRTVWALWGDAQAINAGDGMFATAQLAMAEECESDPRLAVRGLRALNRACQSLCEGQFLDLEFEGRIAVGLDDYLAMVERKTAALMEAACFLGALYGGADEAALDAYSSFGKHLGLAFQMQDDYLGIWGDPGVTGKPTAADVASKKKTLPIVYAMAEASGPDRSLLEAILSDPGPADDSAVARVLEILARCGAADFTAAEVLRRSNAALDALASARAEARARAELESLCRKLTVRTR